MKHKKKIIGIVISLVIIGIISLFITQTSRGGSLMIYLFGGMGVPTEIKIGCVNQVENNIKIKFESPPDFPWQALDAIKGFWYYSYFNECLYKNGYDFSGNLIEKSSVTQQTNDAVYKNERAYFSLRLPSQTTLVRNDELDVDYHHKLYETEFVIGTSSVYIHVYDFRDKESDLLELLKKEIKLSRIDGAIQTYDKQILDDGTVSIFVQQGKISGYIFVIHNMYVVHIFTNTEQLKILEEIAKSLSVDEKK